MCNIGVVLVTYNRLEKLKQALEKFDNQTMLPNYILVVNNASSDGTTDYLHEWEKIPAQYRKIVVDSGLNVGGAGGFYTGLLFACKQNADWIWVSDDDAFPDERAISESAKFISQYDKIDGVSAICGQVINYGETDLEHRRLGKCGMLSYEECAIEKEKYQKKYFDVDLTSFVGTIINVNMIKKIGLPREDFFIYYDDTEYSMRLKEIGRILCVPSIKIYHDVVDNPNVYWKIYYGTRNQVQTFRMHLPRRYYKILIFRLRTKALVSILIGRKKEINRMKLEAIRDGILGRMGMHRIYKPGWKPIDNF